MPSSEQGATEKPHAPAVIRPGPDAEKPLDLAAGAREKRAKLPSPSERLESRVDTFIDELKRDKLELQREVQRLRIQDIQHLRTDVRWLEERVISQTQAFARIQTSYEWAISFNWLSFALIAIGGGVVSYAAFVPLKSGARTVATIGLTSLVIGVFVQAINSFRGARSLARVRDLQAASARPNPNPAMELSSSPGSDA
jgi:hypothetical protein